MPPKVWTVCELRTRGWMAIIIVQNRGKVAFRGEGPCFRFYPECYSNRSNTPKEEIVMKKLISRRQFLAAAGVLAAAGALTACGGSSASTAGSAAGSAAG